GPATTAELADTSHRVENDIARLLATLEHHAAVTSGTDHHTYPPSQATDDPLLTLPSAADVSVIAAAAALAAHATVPIGGPPPLSAAPGGPYPSPSPPTPPPPKRAAAACLRCREKKRKCDAKAPVCGNCARARARLGPSPSPTALDELACVYSEPATLRRGGDRRKGHGEGSLAAKLSMLEAALAISRTGLQPVDRAESRPASTSLSPAALPVRSSDPTFFASLGSDTAGAPAPSSTVSDSPALSSAQALELIAGLANRMLPGPAYAPLHDGDVDDVDNDDNDNDNDVAVDDGADVAATSSPVDAMVVSRRSSVIAASVASSSPALAHFFTSFPTSAPSSAATVAAAAAAAASAGLWNIPESMFVQPHTPGGIAASLASLTTDKSMIDFVLSDSSIAPSSPLSPSYYASPVHRYF
ncbi:hypothetical protein HK405_015941, partial [Cladochytrium tenue]